MKVFENDKSSYTSKVNFVDDNDVYIGYDIEQSCCEHAGWYLAEKVTPYDDESGETEHTYNLEPYFIDKNYFKSIETDALDEGLMIVFRLVAKGKQDLYLHIFNAHNGYYGHGLEVKHGGEKVIDEWL